MGRGYDYQSKGDAFTRGERALPRAFARRHRQDRSWYIRRLRVDEVPKIRVRDMVKALPGDLERSGATLEVSERYGLFFNPRERTVTLVSIVPPRPRPEEGSTVRVRVTIPNFGGVRWWLECPMCEGLRSVIYGVVFTSQPGCAVGCQKCLGLTHASRARHKCADQDGAVLGVQPENPARSNSEGARLRALMRLNARVSRLLS